MNLYISSFLLAVIVTVCSSKYCTPDQWQGGMGGIGGYTYGEDKGFIKEYTEIYYDYTGRRVAYKIWYENNNFKDEFHILSVYGHWGGKIYVVDKKRGDKCWVKRTFRKFERACIPKDAYKMPSYYLGLKGGLNVTTWGMQKYGVEVSITAQILDENTIAPVSETIMGRIRKTDMLTAYGYSNIVPEIKNKTVFDIPEQCEEMNDKSVAFMRFHEDLGDFMTFLV